MTRLSPATFVTSTASQDDYIGTLPVPREQMVHIRLISFSNNGITPDLAGQRAMEATENV
jgi:hypothetical protein